MPHESLQMCSKTVSLWKPSAPIPERVGLTEVPLLSSPGGSPCLYPSEAGEGTSAGLKKKGR